VTEKIEHANFHIEFYGASHKWVPTGDAPMSFSAMVTPQILPKSVWVAYVDYLNEREKYAPTESKGGYRLSSYTTTTTKEVIHV
jgi:hypothetical protein